MDTYDLVYADPPWMQNARNNAKTRFGAGCPYPLMETEDICRLRVPMAKDSILFMWATWPKLPEALKVMDFWGFTYKTVGFVWVKVNRKDLKPFHGIGYYTKHNTEICLLGTRGKVTKPATDKISQLVIEPELVVAPLTAHSAKPQAVRDAIQAMFPAHRKLEMFARDKDDPNFAYWGNEVASDVQIG